MKKIANRFFAAVFSIYLFTATVFAADVLVPVGEVVGLELSTGNVTVAAFDDTLQVGRNGGLQIGDAILSIDGSAVTNAEDVRRALNQSDGSVEITVSRRGQEKCIRLNPAITTDGPRLGVYLRQGITGIGTVTWYNPDTGAFGTLGHGVSSGKGDLLQMTSGKIYPASIISVQKGKSGSPGQLKGALEADHLLGTISANTSQGVFGRAPGVWTGEAIPVATFSEIHAGSALIRSTITGSVPQDYSVEILKIYPKTRSDGRNFLLKVTDPTLLGTTGGIVQGMSGSPIIQDGKLIGAVTHVLVNDPTTGYGIFIENMLDAAG